jgi:glycosyltransferase involved in cell wall biosynthesis
LGYYWGTIFKVILKKNKKLIIISHTEHHYTSNGDLAGWGPTVNEVNFLSNYWDEVVHISCLQPFSHNPSFQSYTNSNIRFEPIPIFGGKKWFQKFDIMYLLPRIIFTILKEVKGASHIQIRVPMGIGLYVLPMFLLVPRKYILWVKYANNWGKVSNSMGYRFQRWFLLKNYLNCNVTINGNWPRQSNHLKSFENPCISAIQYSNGQKVSQDFSKPWVFVFAGRFEQDKGLDLIIEVIGSLPLSAFAEWVFIGDGPMRSELVSAFEQAGMPIRLTGFIGQDDVHYELSKGHFLVLPSKSEGFPKVLAEGWNYGVVPIVSPVGSIPHYLEHGDNGFLMERVDGVSLKKAIDNVLRMDSEYLSKVSNRGKEESMKFTFNRYISRLESEVF